MALTKTVTFGKSGTRPYGVLTVTETATSVPNNTSTLTVKLTLKRPSAVSSTANKSASVTVNGTNWTWNGTIGGSGDKTLINKTLTVKHNADGTKTINLAASIRLDISWSGTQLGTISGSDTMTLSKIQQYSSVSQSLSSRTETTAVIRYSCDLTIDYLWWSIDNGNTWTGLNVADGTSGTYTISGLAANTTYQIKTKVRNKASQLTTVSSALSVTTYNWPYATSMPDFTIGEKVTIGFYNPLGRSFTFYVVANGVTIANNWTVSGTSYSGINATSSQNQLYATIPNAKSATYQIRCVYNGNAVVKTGGKYSVDAAACKPAITGGSYQDTNSTTVNITGNNQLIVQNRSIVRYTATGLSAQKSATVASCKVTINGNTYNLSVSGTTATGGNAVINSGTDVQAVLTVTDSRGLTASKTINVSMLALWNPSAVITLERQNNFYTATNIKVDARYASVNGTNTISITYSCTKDGASSATVTGTLQDNVQATINLDNAYGWAVKVTLTDRFGMTTSYNLYVSRGMPIIFFDRALSSVGINCFPVDEESLEVNGQNIFDALFFKSGDTFTITNFQVVGMLSNSGAALRFSVTLPKNINNLAVSCTTMKLNARHSDGGYVFSSAFVSGGYDVLTDSSITVSISEPMDNAITVNLAKTSAYNGTNNTPVTVSIETMVLQFS